MRNIYVSICIAEYIINFHTFKPCSSSYLEQCIVGREYLNVFYFQGTGPVKRLEKII